MKQNKNAVITFVFNNYDWLREPITIDDGFDYYCLTDDKNLESKVWKCIYIPSLDSDSLTDRQKVNIAKADFLKYIPDGYEWWICMDASVKIVGNLSDLISYFEENSYDIGISIEETTKTFKEAYYLFEKYGRIDHDCVETFKKYVDSENIDWEEYTGMIEGTMKVYKNTKYVLDMLNEMHYIYKKACDFKDLNDQCYLTIAFSKYDDKLNTCFFYNQLYHTSKYFERYKHNSDYRLFSSANERSNNNFFLGKYRKLKTFL